MLRFALALLIAVFATVACADEKVAFFAGGLTASGTAPPSSCPFPATAALDGCANAPAYINSTLSFQDASLFTDGTMFQSGQSTSGLSQIAFNVTGKDFPAGVNPGTYYDGVNKISSPTPGASILWDASQYPWSTDPLGLGCTTGSGKNAATQTITCVSNGNTNLSGIDLTPNGQCWTLYITAASGVTTGTFRMNNYRWVSNNNTGTDGVHGCANPYQTYPIRINLPTALGNAINVDASNGVIDPQNFQSYNQISGQNAAFIVSTGGTVKADYIYCPNNIARCMSITACTTVDTSYNVQSNIGWWPGTLHGEFALYYLARYADPTCYYDQRIDNQTSWTPSNGNAPAVTSPISTAEPLNYSQNGTNPPVTSASYTAGTGQIAFTLSSAVWGTSPAVGAYIVVSGLTGGYTNLNGMWPIASVSGGGTSFVLTTTQTGLATGALTGMVVHAFVFRSLEAKYNIEAINVQGGASPYYVLGDAPAFSVAGQTGSYGVGDILAISGASCGTAPKVRVTAVSSGTVTGIGAYDGGNCPSQPNSGTYYSTTCLSGACVAGAGAGVTVKSAYQKATSGYGIQLGAASYVNSIDVESNFVGNSGVSAGSNTIVWAGVVCPINTSYKNNINIETGAGIATTSLGAVGCPAGP